MPTGYLDSVYFDKRRKHSMGESFDVNFVETYCSFMPDQSELILI